MMSTSDKMTPPGDDSGTPTKSTNQDKGRSCKKLVHCPKTFAILGVLIIPLFLQDVKSFGHPKFRTGTVSFKHVEDVGVSGCSNLQTSLPLLTSLLRTDPENGLSPLSLRSDHEDAASQQIFNFPGLKDNLLSSAFRERCIAFVGDSTLFYAAKWLFVLLQSRDDQKQMTVFQGLSNLNLTDGKSHFLKVSFNRLGKQ
jgi:hypothetical protein